MEQIKTREQVNEEALKEAIRAFGIATEYDLLPNTDAVYAAVTKYQESLWQPIEFAPKKPYPDRRSDNLLLRSAEYSCVEGRWMAKDGEAIMKDGWYILGFTRPIKIEPTHFQYILK